MAERTIVITGATRGIGRAAALKLAGPGVRLVLVARNEAKAAALRAEILAARPGAVVEHVFADFARLRTVAEAGRLLVACYGRIDVLINNAGLHAFGQRVTEDGFAEMVSANYLAPWLLTAILRDTLVASAPSRVVTVASEASRRAAGLDPVAALTDTRPFGRLGSSAVYGGTKLMDILFALELARRLAGTSVVSHALDPGFNVTGIGRELPFGAFLERLLTTLRVAPPERGAGIIVRLATDVAFSRRSGGYYSWRDAAPLSPVPPADSPAMQEALWAATASLLEPFLAPAST